MSMRGTIVVAHGVCYTLVRQPAADDAWDIYHPDGHCDGTIYQVAGAHAWAPEYATRRPTPDAPPPDHWSLEAAVSAKLDEVSR